MILQGGKGNVDKEFFRRVKKLTKIAIPSLRCREMGYVGIIGALVIIRTKLSIMIADVNGKVVGSIVNQHLQGFLKAILVLILFALPASFCNSAMEYYNKKLALEIKKNLTKYFTDRYLSRMHFYKMCNLDNRIGNPDQRLT